MPATNQSAVSTLIREVLADPDLAHDEVFRRLLQAGLQDLVDAEAAAVIGAQRYERTPERTNRRNGKRLKTVATTAGEVELAIPKLRTGSFFPSLLHPRRRVDKALYAVICSAWIEGVSTRKVDDLVRALGNESGISRSTVSRICKDIDEGVHEFLSRRLDHTWFPYLFVDATYLDVRVGHRVVCRALVVATGVSAEGRREILGMALGDAETVDFWTSFLRSLRERGLKVPSPEDPTGVVLVTSDAHAGIRAAVRAILPGAAWQRCRAPLRPHHHLQAGLGPIQASGRPGLHDLRPHQQGGRHRPVQARHRHFKGRSPFRIARMLIDAEPDPTAFATTPPPWGAPGQDPAAATPSNGSTARPGAAQTSPRVLPDSESARPLIGSALPEQRGVAVRRTPLPLPYLTATPDRHAPHRQHRRRRRPRRPAPHHHLTERTPHQET